MTAYSDRATLYFTLINIIIGLLSGLIAGWYVLVNYNGVAGLDIGALLALGFSAICGVIWFLLHIGYSTTRHGFRYFFSDIQLGIKLGCVSVMIIWLVYILASWLGAILANIFS